jgi:hypothetical protein
MRDVNLFILLHCIRGTGASSAAACIPVFLEMRVVPARIHMSERILARLVLVTYLATGAGFLVKALS